MQDIISKDMASGVRKDPAGLLDRMRVLCSRREYCRSDIMKKLMTALGDRNEAQKLVDTLVSEKYIDDSRYASAYARDKAGIAGWGAVKIRYMLMSKGISEDVVAASLAGIDEDRAASRLHRLLEAKARSLRNDPQRSMKLRRFALSRGYSYDEATEAVEDIICKENDDII